MLSKRIYGWLGLTVCGLAALCGCRSLGLNGDRVVDNSVSSPDGKVRVVFDLNGAGTPLYSVQYEGKAVLEPSPLGLVRSDGAFDAGLTWAGVSKTETVKDDYTMLTGKRKDCEYRANRKVFRVKDADGRVMSVIFQVSNDGAAFRYAFEGERGKAVSIEAEKTGLAFAEDTLSWLHFMPEGKTGWSRTQPSYEEYYEAGKAVGQPSPSPEGWALPALFKTADGVWALFCDSDVDASYCAVRLAQDSTGGVYRVAFPHPQEHRGPEDPVNPQVTLPFASPWRVLMVGPSPATMVESTLMTDVAAPCTLENADFVEPGRAVWHWLRYSDESSTLEYAESFLDFAVKMNWEYMLIDCTWDRNIGYEKMAEFVKKASGKGVDVILWYNSNGPWNDAPMTPKHRMHTREVRREEFAKLREMGVRGVKVDFFPGDKQATMDLYLELFRDAADFGILVNCHGATIPRGWQRTYPNLMTMESVRGMEYCTFEQRNADRQPRHCTILPFTRNAIGSMDFTPVVFNPRIRGVRLVTLPGFELALSVVFESGIQHFGLVPEEYDGMPESVRAFLRDVPVAWDETRLVDGYPGEYAVIARRAGETWYIGAINGENKAKTLALDLSFLPAGKAVTVITDGENREFVTRSADTSVREMFLKPHGGFVMVVTP